MTSFETLLYSKADGIASLSLNRPEVRNAINQRMQDELREVWHDARYDNDVRCVVLTAEGDHFCTGIDRAEAVSESNTDAMAAGNYPGYPTPWMYDDPGRDVGPKARDCWKPVIAAVQGQACGGAFYILGEVEFIIASDDATFFEPHVTYGMTAAFEPMQMLTKMPFQEIMRMSLLGADERMSAERAREIGLVSEVVPRDELRERVEWAARVDRGRTGHRGPGHHARAVDRPRGLPPPGHRARQPVHPHRVRRRRVPRGSEALRVGPAPEVAPQVTTGLRSGRSGRRPSRPAGRA